MLTSQERLEGMQRALVAFFAAALLFGIALTVNVIPSKCETGHVGHFHRDASDDLIPVVTVNPDGTMTTTLMSVHSDARDWDEFVCDEEIPGVSLYAYLFQNRRTR